MTYDSTNKEKKNLYLKEKITNVEHLTMVTNKNIEQRKIGQNQEAKAHTNK